MGVKRPTLHQGPWQLLFQRALGLVDDFTLRGGISDPFWTFGGGTVLMFRHGHRSSKDVGIFVPDPQYLGFVTPRLSDKAAHLTQDYTETATFVKLQFDEGEIDFVAAHNLLPAELAWERWRIMGRTVRVETAAEIVAKKLYHRGDRATARDLFDLALVIEKEPGALREAAPFLVRHREAFLAQVSNPGRGLMSAFEAIDALDFRPTYRGCVELASDFLLDLRAAK